MKEKAVDGVHDRPKVSVIMPSLDVAEYIDECVQSALSQTLREMEIICVDAGSTDGTWEKLLAYAKKEDVGIPIRLLHSDVKSYGCQVNMGLGEAAGEYVAILETDDYVSPDMYETLYELAAQTGSDMVKSDFDIFYTRVDGRRIFQPCQIWGDDPSQYNRVIDPRVNESLYSSSHCIWNGIYSRGFLMENGIRLNESPGAAYQDIGFAPQVLACARRVYYSNKSFYKYRTDRAKSSSNSLGGLQFGYQEFRHLLEDDFPAKKKMSHAGLCRHMAQTLQVELSNLLRATEYDAHSDRIEPYARWFVDQITLALEQGAASPSDLGIFYESYKAIATDMEKYAADLKRQDDLRQENEERVLSCTKGKRTVIFGAGILGGLSAGLLQENGREIVAFCDNDERLWGTEKLGYAILSPMECARRHRDATYLIANKNHADEIEKQLCDMEVRRENICRFVS